MELDRLLEGVEVLERRGETAGVGISAVVYDSRRAGPGGLFCCIPGAMTDGHEFASDAVAAGAVAVLCEREVDVEVPQVRVATVRPAMALAAATLCGRPSEKMTIVGVTGTNGKTTVAHLLRSVLAEAGESTELVGTLTGIRTTPEAPDLQLLLAQFLGRGVSAVAMEVSSHALDQHRVDAVRFRAAVFTNLSQDHLDYHQTMERYFAAKASLFESARTDVAVVNASDPWGRRLIERLEGAAEPELVTFSADDAVEAEVGLDSSRFVWRGQTVRLPLGGRFNVMNALAGATAAAALGVPADAIVAGLETVEPVSGRMEPVDLGQPFSVIVDYAHTPDGLERVLAASRSARPSARLAVVFGCGGERDRGKRPLMGEVAGRLADLVVVTSDNPRGEDPVAIIDQVTSGVPEGANLVVEPDRRAAIRRALAWAAPGDVVVLAGKGHETVQQIGPDAIPFDDRVVAREEIEASGGIPA